MEIVKWRNSGRICTIELTFAHVASSPRCTCGRRTTCSELRKSRAQIGSWRRAFNGQSGLWRKLMASSAKRVGMITAFQRNLTELLDSIEDCLAKRRILPCLMLLYSGIDVIASLEAGTASRSAFTKWVNRYVLKSTSLSCTASDLYGARCGILHTL